MRRLNNGAEIRRANPSTASSGPSPSSACSLDRRPTPTKWSTCRRMRREKVVTLRCVCRGADCLSSADLSIAPLRYCDVRRKPSSPNCQLARIRGSPNGRMSGRASSARCTVSVTGEYVAEPEKNCCMKVASFVKKRAVGFGVKVVMRIPVPV